MDRQPSRFRRAMRRIFGPFERFAIRHSWGVGIIAVVTVFGILYLLPLMVYDIGPGQLGVRWYRFFGGTDTKNIMGEGIHLIAPWDRVYIYDVRLQREERDFDALSSDGLPLTVRIAWRYEIIPTALGLLHKYVGPNYNDIMIAPDIAERVRDVLAVNRPQEIWSQRRPEIEHEILDAVRYNLRTSLNPVGTPEVEFVHVEDVLMTGVTLPAGVQDAIVAKLTADQDQQKWDYVLLKEKKEAERKRIEASGIRAFQDVVSYGLTDGYLRWRGIEATLELAKSNNAKVVVIGNPANGLPLILGNLDDKAGTAGTLLPGVPTAPPPGPERTAAPSPPGDSGTAVPGPSLPRPVPVLGSSKSQAVAPSQREITPAIRNAGPRVPGTSIQAGPAHPGSSPEAGPPQPGSVTPGTVPGPRVPLNTAAPVAPPPGKGTLDDRPSQAAPLSP